MSNTIKPVAAAIPTSIRVRSLNFSKDNYNRQERDDGSAFQSDKYADFKSWKEDLGFVIPESETMPVCYRGSFAVQKKQFLNHRKEAWEKMVSSLSRGDNIVEGHYAERVWASILTEIDEDSARAVDEVFSPHISFVANNAKCPANEGMVFINKPQLELAENESKLSTNSFDIESHIKEDDKICVIHVGPHKTGSTTLQEALPLDLREPIRPKPKAALDAVKQDNYEVPVFPNQKFGAKNHAGLANCMTPVQSRNLLCPDETHRIDTLNYFQAFVKNAADNGSNILLSSEELNHPELNLTELTSYLVPEYKIHVVLYYRRFYDWIHSTYNTIEKNSKIPHNPTFANWLTPEILNGYQRMYSMAIYNRFQEVPGVFNVSVVNMHEDPGDFDTLERFFCDHMQAPHVCELAKSQETEHSNPSVDLDFGLFRARIQQYHSIKLLHGR